MQHVYGTRTIHRLLVALALGGAGLGLVAWLTSGTPAPSQDEARQPPATAPALPDTGARWGVQVLGIRRSAADYMLDFRYRVTDAEKAADLLDRRQKPQLIVEETGRTLQVPVSAKIGPLRQSAKFAKADRNYFMFFANPGRHVQAGDQVTVVIGDFRAEHLTVE